MYRGVHSLSFEMPTKDRMKDDRCNGSAVVSNRNHGKVVGVDARNGKADEDGGQSTMEDGVVDENEVSKAQRVSLLAEKQSQLEEVFNTHDTLVCHSFVWKRLSITLYRYEKHFIWKTSV